MGKKLKGYALSILITLIVLELMSLVVIRSGLVPGIIPSYSISGIRLPMWADMDPHFGVWHPENYTYRSHSACFDVELQSNAYGMIDRERTKRSEERRIVVLGDSFVEGFGVAREKRFTDLLESETGIPFLNFGTSGVFGPTQYWQLYKHLAKEFDHSEVWIFILPANDFTDDYPRPGRYHPYLDGEYPDYELKYSLESPEQSEVYLEPFSVGRYVREFSYLVNVLYYIKARIDLWGQEPAEIRKEPSGYSGYFDYREREMERLRYVLDQIRKSSEGKRMRVFSIPRLQDFHRYEAEQRNRFRQDMMLNAEAGGYDFQDLLPLMYSRYSEKWEELFLSCDGHWSEKGHRAATRIILEEINLE